MELERDMSVREWMLEKIKMYCDADRRKKEDEARLESYCPTVGEAMQCAAE